jgi:uridine kinase
MPDSFYCEDVKRVVEQIVQILQRQSRITIGIDGCGGAGKSTFARELSEALENSTLISMDDFYLPSSERNKIIKNGEIGWQFDWKRMEAEVLKPLLLDSNPKYRKYDWKNDSLADWTEVDKDSIVIVEGVYSLRRELTTYYSMRIWLDCPAETRLKRGLQRDGEQARSQWTDDWMKEETRYVREHRPYMRADIIIKGGT